MADTRVNKEGCDAETATHAKRNPGKDDKANATENMSSPDDEFEKIKMEGNNFFKMGNYKEADVRYSMCIKMDGEKTAAYTNRALCRLRLDQNKKAELDCNEALQRDSKNVKAYYRRAAARKGMRNYEGSIDDLNKLLIIEPSNIPAQKELRIVQDILKQKMRIEGDDFFKKRKYQEAVKCYSSWIDVDHKDVLALTNRALCYLELKEFTKAEKDCDDVIDIDPENEDAYCRRSLARKGQGNFSGSEEDWVKLYTLTKDKGFYKEPDEIQIQTLEPRQMNDLLEESLQKEICQKITFDGNDFFAKGKYEEAKNCYTSCLEIDPNQPVALIKRAECYLKLGQDLNAERDCTKALELDPKNAEALFWRAVAWKGLENFAGSKSDLEDVLALNQFYDEARVELEEIKDLINYFSKTTEPQGSKCPLCRPEVEKPHGSPSMPIVIKDMIVYSGTTKRNFEEATTSYIDEYFPQWYTRTYRVPAGHFHDRFDEDHKTHSDLKPEKKQKNTPVKTKEVKNPRKPSDIKTERDGSNAVETIVQLLEEWGSNKAKMQPMFVLKDYEFSNYLKNTNLKGHLITEKGDHDILVIHRQFGVLAIQVKCSEKEKELRKAYQQVCKDERIFKQMNVDMDFAANLKFTKAIVMTEMTDRSKFLKLLCDKHKSIMLTKSNMNLTDVKRWLGKIGFVPSEDGDVFTGEQYKSLVGRYVGLVSAVPYRTLSEATREARDRIEILQLNPEQLNILQSNNNLLLIQGASGTGKTFLLVEKAKMMARQGHGEVYVILLSAINEITSHLNIESRYYVGSQCAHVQLRNHIKHLISLEEDTLDNLHVICEHEIRQRSDTDSYPKKKCLEHYVSYFLDLFAKDFHQGNKVFDFFFDEVPRTFFDATTVSPLHLFKYSEFYAGKSGTGAYKPRKGGLRTLWIAKTADQPCLQKPFKFYTPFAVKNLSRCVRLTKANFEFVKAIVHNYMSTESNKHLISGCRLLIDYFPGNVIQGVKPLCAFVEECKTHIECDEEKLPDHPQVSSNVCLIRRLKKKLKAIFERLTPITCPIHILVNEDFFGLLKGPKKSNIKDIVVDACAELGCFVTGHYVSSFYENEREACFKDVKVVITNYEPFVGCETEILIAVVDNYSLIMSAPINLLGMLSRVMGQLVIVRLPQNGPKLSKLEQPFERACNTHALQI